MEYIGIYHLVFDVFKNTINVFEITQLLCYKGGSYGPGGSFSSLFTYQRCFMFYLCYKYTHTPRTNISPRSGREATSARLITSIQRVHIARKKKKNILNLPRVSTFDLETYERKIFF